tara:strand:- start:439 stop:771 length:333 start_codon:yes stop_codon:yes gene_type:complete
MQDAEIDTLQEEVQYLKKTLFFKMKCNAFYQGIDATGSKKYSTFFYYDHDTTLVSGLLQPTDDFISTSQDEYFKKLDPTGTVISMNRTIGSNQFFKMYTSKKLVGVQIKE